MVFSFLKCSDDKEELKELIANRKEEYYNMSDESVELLATITRSKELLKIKKTDNNQGGNDMCKALEDIKQEGRESAIKDLIQKKIAKGKTVSEIAEALEEDESTIEALMKEL